MRKHINKFLLSIIMVQILYTPVVNGVEITKLLASEVFYFDSVDSIDWSQLKIGDKVDLGQQTLDHFENYTFVNSDLMYDLVNYNPETETIDVNTASAADRRTAIFEPEFQLDLNNVSFFGTRFSTDVSSGVLANRGYVSLMTRPKYDRISANADWANSSTGENLWTLNADSNKLALKYREDGRYQNTQSLPTNKAFNTLSLSIDPKTKTTTFSVCIMPSDDTTYNCKSTSARDEYVLATAIDSKYLDNEFLSLAYSPGVDKVDSTIHIEGINTVATVESYGEIYTKNPVVYVPLGTSISDVHDIAQPTYNEFIDYTVTAVNKPVPLSDMVSDGGYNPNAVGKYQLRYNVTRGFDGGIDSTDTVSVEVVDPDEMISLSGNNVKMPVGNAPLNKTQLIEAMEETAYDPQTQTDLTSSIGIYSYGGYDFNKPTAGNYNITFYVKDENRRFIYDTHTLTLVNGFDINDITQTSVITKDSTNNNLVDPSDKLTVEVKVENTTNADLLNTQIAYDIDENYFDLNSITNVTGDMNTQNISAKGFEKKGVTLRAGETFTYSYDINVNDSFKISSNQQDLNNTTDFSTVSSYGVVAQEKINFPLSKNFKDNVKTLFTVTDESNNQLLATNEKTTIVAAFENQSEYELSNVEININELTKKVNISDISVKSSVRDNIMDSTTISGNKVVIGQVRAHEIITVTATGTAISEFKNGNAANFNAKYYAYSNDGTIAYELQDSESLDIDISSISNIVSHSTITDHNNDVLGTNETFEILFDIKNTGSIPETNVKVDLDIDDINIANEQITNDDVEMQFSLNGESSYQNYKVNANSIVIDKLLPGESVEGIVKLRTTSEFNADAYIDDLLAIAVTPDIRITTDHNLEYVDQLSLGLEHNAYANNNVNVHQVTGDGDNKIDAAETFDIVADIAIDGSMPVPNLQVEFDLNANDAAVISNVEYTVLLEGKDITNDVVIYDDIVTLPHAKRGQHYKVIASVTYGSGAADTYSSNIVTMRHPYLNTQSRSANIQIDTQNLKKITFDSSISTTSVRAGEFVHVTVDLANEGFTTENNLKLTLNGDSTNIDLKNPKNIQVSSGNVNSSGNVITIDKLSPSETKKLEFDLKIADTFTISPTMGTNVAFDFTINGKLSDGTQKNINFTVKPIIEQLSFNTSLTARPLIGSGTIHTSDLIEYKYSLENGNDANLTNGKITLDLTDQEISKLNEIKVTSTDPRFSYNLNGDEITFDNLKANETINVVYVVETNDAFDQSATIDMAVSFNSDFAAKQDQVSVEKELSELAAIDSETNLISTSSGNMLIGQDETVTYEVHLLNEGDINLEQVVVQTSQLHEDFVSQKIISIVDQDGKEFTDYTVIDDSKIVINKFNVHDDLTIRYEVETSSNINYDPNLSISTTISNDLVSQTISLPLAIDLSRLGELQVDYIIEETKSDNDDKLDPGETANLYVTITNTGSVVFNDVHVIDTMNDANLKAIFDGIEIYDQNGTPFTDYTKKDSEIYIENFPGETALTFKYQIKAEELFTADNFATMSMDVSANYPLEGVLTIPYEQTLPIDRKNNMDYDAQVKITSDDGHQILSPGDGVTAEVTVTNNGKIDLENVEIIPNVVSNLDESTLRLAVFDEFNASLVNNKVIVKHIGVGETETIKLKFNLDSKLNSDQDFVVSGKVNSRLMSKQVSDKMPLDRSGSSLTTDMEFSLTSGDGDGKIDPSEVYELDIVITNNGNTTLDNIYVSDMSDDENIKSKVYVGANTAVTTDGSSKVISSLDPGQDATLRYQVVMKDVFNSDQKLSLDYSIEHPDVADVQGNVSRDIDIANNTSFSDSLSVVDSDKDGLAFVSEPLTFTYNLENTGKRRLSNIDVAIDISDSNLDASSLVYKVYIDDQAQNVIFDSNTNTFKIPHLAVGETLKIEYTVNTKSQIISSFISSVLKSLNIDINSSVSVSDDANSIESQLSASMPVSRAVADIAVSSIIETQDDDQLLIAKEQYKQIITVENIGKIDTKQILVRLSSAGKNIGKLNNVVVKTKDGNTLTAGEDYTLTNNTLKFDNLAIGQELIIEVTYTAPNSLYSGEYVNHKAVVVPTYNNSYTVSNTLYPDISARNIEYQLSHDLDNTINYIIGKRDRLHMTINNVGTVNERNVEIDMNERSTDFIIDSASVAVYKNGEAYDDIQIDPETNRLVLAEVNSGDDIEVISNVMIDPDMNAPDDEVLDDYILYLTTLISYEDESEFDKTFEVEIPKTQISQINSKLVIGENAKTEDEVKVGDKVTGKLTIKNNDFLRQERATIDFQPDPIAYDQGSFVIESVTDKDGNAISSSSYSVDGNILTLLDFRYEDEWVITYNYNVKPVIDLGYQLDAKGLEITDNISIVDDAKQSTSTAAKTSLSKDSSKISITGDATDESADAKAAPGELVTVDYVITNDGGYVEYDVPVKVNAGIGSTSSNSVTAENIDIKYEGELIPSVDYELDIDNSTVYIKRFVPGDAIQISVDYKISDVIQNSDMMFFLARIISNVSKAEDKLIFMPTDLSNVTHMDISDSLEDENKNNYVEDNESLTYSMSLVNNGNLNYMDVMASIDLSTANAVLDEQSLVVKLNGEETSDYDVDLVDDILNVYLIDFTVGQNYEITFDYKLRNDQPVSKTEINTNVSANHFTHDSKLMMRTDIDPIHPEVPLNTAPEITYNDVTINEGDELTNAQLKAKIGATAYDAEEGDVNVEYGDIEIDYDAPGTYQIQLTAKDSHNLTSSAVVNVEVIDLKPVISTSKKPVIVKLGSDKINYIQAFNVVASEKTRSDLTNKVVVDDSQVKLNQTGVYNLEFSVEDQEGNIARTSSAVNVVRSNSDVSEITPDIEANYPPTITANDITIDEETILTESELVAAANVQINDYEDSNLTPKIIKNTIDYSTPGSYELTFEVTDSGHKKATVKIAATVRDLQPKIEAEKETVVVPIGTKSINYTSAFGLVATEIVEGDMTEQMSIDDSALNLNATGIYEVIASVEDEEHNRFELPVKVNVVRNSNPDVELPDMGANTLPVITYSDVTISEETELTDIQLKNRIGATAYDGEDGFIDVEYSDFEIDYSKPGVYNIGLSVVDSSGAKTQEVASVTIDDILPRLSANPDQAYIKVGSKDINYVNLMGIIGTEIITGDLTNAIVVDDSNVNLNVTGTYMVGFSVADSEGNIAHLEAPVKVVRNLNNIENIDGDNATLEANMPPVISASNFTINEEQVLTNNQIVDFAHAQASDYEDSNVSIEVKHNINFKKPGKYLVEFIATDSAKKSSKVEIEVTVLDKLPNIESQKLEVSHIVGNETMDYISRYGLVASEITTGDLTSAIEIDDSNVNYNKTGTYDVIAKVVDEEGNKASIDLKINIIRNIITNPDANLPTIDVIAPVLSANVMAKINEEQNLTELELLQLFNVTYNVASHLQFTVSHNIDYSKPGVYDIIFTNGDIANPSENITITAQLTIEDLLPTISSENKLVVARGDDVSKHVDELNIVASEITNGDLTGFVDIDSSNVDTSKLGTYNMYLSVMDNEGNRVQKRVLVEVVNSLSPVITSEDVVISSSLANTIDSKEDLIKITNTLARDYNGKDITGDVKVEDIDNILTQTEYQNGEEYKLKFSITNKDNRKDTQTSTIKISDSDSKIELKSNSPVVFGIKEDVDLEAITQRSHVRAYVTENNDTSVNYLETSDIVSTNYVPNQLGLFFVKYKYEGNELNGTHNVLVYITKDGEMPDNVDIQISENLNSNLIMPGEQVKESFTISNNSNRTKTMSAISHSKFDENIKRVSKIDIFNKDDELVKTVGSNARMERVLNDLEIPSGETYTVEITYDTNELFTYRKEINTAYDIEFDGEIRTIEVVTKVNPKAIDVKATASFDKDSYKVSENGTIKFVIENNGTMDTMYSQLEMNKNLTNIKLGEYRVDGLIVDNDSKIMIPAKSKLTVEVDFKVNDTIVYGDDTIHLLSDTGQTFDIVIPVDTTVEAEDDDKSVTNDKEAVGSIDTKDSNDLDQKNEASETEEDSESSNSKMFDITKTGKSSIIILVVILFAALLLLKKKVNK